MEAWRAAGGTHGGWARNRWLRNGLSAGAANNLCAAPHVPTARSHALFRMRNYLVMASITCEAYSLSVRASTHLARPPTRDAGTHSSFKASKRLHSGLQARLQAPVVRLRRLLGPCCRRRRHSPRPSQCYRLAPRVQVQSSHTSRSSLTCRNKPICCSCNGSMHAGSGAPRPQLSKLPATRFDRTRSSTAGRAAAGRAHKGGASGQGRT